MTPPLPVGVALAGTATGAVGGAFVASSSWPFWRDDLNCPSPAPVVPVSPGTGERERDVDVSMFFQLIESLAKHDATFAKRIFARLQRIYLLASIGRCIESAGNAACLSTHYSHYRS